MREQDAGINHHQLVSGQVYAQYGERGGIQYKTRRNHLPLNKYLSGGHITNVQHYAGEKLYSLYITSSHLHSPITMRFGDISGGLKEYEKKFCISQEYFAAIMAIQGGIIRDMVTKVCLDGLKATRGNMDYLRDGLNQLVVFFKDCDKQN